MHFFMSLGLNFQINIQHFFTPFIKDIFNQCLTLTLMVCL